MSEKLTDEMLQEMQQRVDSLISLSDTQLICLALSEIIFVLDVIPPGKRIPLYTALSERVKQHIPDMIHKDDVI